MCTRYNMRLWFAPPHGVKRPSNLQVAGRANKTPVGIKSSDRYHKGYFPALNHTSPFNLSTDQNGAWASRSSPSNPLFTFTPPRHLLFSL
jgi:hypothetical protein